MPTMGSVPVQTATFLYALLKTTKHEILINHTDRAGICDARNLLLSEFLKSDCDFLFFLDDDNPPESVECLDALLSVGKPIVSGIVPSRTPDHTGRHKICVFSEEIKPTGELTYLPTYGELAREPFRIANCGTGCVIVSREIASKVSERYDRPFESRIVTYYRDGDEWVRDELCDVSKIAQGTLRFKRHMGEDLLFFERCRDL